MAKVDIEKYTRLFLKDKAAADRYWARCRGTAQDSNIDDEMVSRVKNFLKNKLSPENLEMVCSMLDGAGEAEDDTPTTAAGKPLREAHILAGDAASFNSMFPGLASVRIDNSGIPIPRRPASTSAAAGAKSFAEMYPGLAKIRQA